MLLIAIGFVLFLFAAVLDSYVTALAAVLIMGNREFVAFFVSLVPACFEIISLLLVYFGFQNMRRRRGVRKPRRRHIGPDNADE